MNGGRISGRAMVRGLTAAALLGAALVGLTTTAQASERSGRSGSTARVEALEQARSPSFGRPAGREDPPDTGPPLTEPPVTEPPVTDPPFTEPPVTEPPATEPPVTEPPATEPPATEPPITVPEVQTSVPESPEPASSVPEAPAAAPADPTTTAPRTDPLPVTGSPTALVVALAGLALAAGALVVRWTRRQADELIGD